MTETRTEGAESPPSSRRRRWVWQLALILAVIAAFVAASLLLPLKQYSLTALEWVRSLGYWGPLVVIAFYIVACVLLLPGGIITVGAGFLFGVVVGSITVSVGATLGATAAFLVGRTVARRWVERKVSGHPKFAAIDEAVGRQGFKIVLLTRLSPVFPFNLQNYAYGLTKVKLWQYVLASWIGMMPGIIVYAYIGAGARSLTDVAAGQAEGGSAGRIFFWVGLAATIVAVVLVSRVAQKAIRQAVPAAGKEETHAGP